MGKKKEIESSSLLMVEGKDEGNFFKALFAALGITHVQIEDIGGKDRFDAAIRAFSKMQGFDEITNLGFVRDAENMPASAAFMSICSSLQHIDLQPPSAIGRLMTRKSVFLLCRITAIRVCLKPFVWILFSRIHCIRIISFRIPTILQLIFIKIIFNSIKKNRKFKYTLHQSCRW